MLRSLVMKAALAAAFLPAAAATAPPAPAVSSFVSDRISVEVIGKGPDVVLIPGLASSREVWRRLVSKLASRYRLHLVQVSGFAGQPPAKDTSAFFAPLVAEIDRYIHAQGLKRPIVIGHSLGGACALALAEREPGLLSKVLIVDSLPFYSAIYGPQVTAESARPFAAQAKAQLMAADAASFEKSEQASAATLVKAPVARERLVAWARASDRATIATAVSDLMVTDLRPGLAAITTPVDVLYPWDPTEGVTRENVDALYSGQYAPLKGVGMKRIDGSLHFMMYDQPEAFEAAVEAFLAQ